MQPIHHHLLVISLAQHLYCTLPLRIPQPQLLTHRYQHRHLLELPQIHTIIILQIRVKVVNFVAFKGWY